MMRKWLAKGLLAAAVALPVLNGAARAGGNDDLGCSKATLKGAYAFCVVQVSEPPSVVVGLGRFDGRGGFSQIDYPGDDFATLGMTFRGPQTGTYMVNPNCTGFMTIDLGTGVGSVTNAIVISSGGRSIHAVVADFKLGGMEVPGQTRVDFWAVASEQDN